MHNLPLVEIDIGLLADDVRVTTSHSLNPRQSEHDLVLSIDVGVQQTENVLELNICGAQQLLASLLSRFPLDIMINSNVRSAGTTKLMITLESWGGDGESRGELREGRGWVEGRILMEGFGNTSQLPLY